MSERDRVFKGKVKQSGIFNFKDFYEFLYDLLMDEGFDVIETRYSETKKGDSKNVEIDWKADKIISSYFTFSIAVRWIIIGLTKIKVKKEDQEVTMDSGTLDLDFTAEIIKDPNNVWEESMFRFVRNIYDKFVIKSRIEDYELKLFQDVNEVVSQLKSFLAIEGQHTY